MRHARRLLLQDKRARVKPRWAWLRKLRRIVSRRFLALVREPCELVYLVRSVDVLFKRDRLVHEVVRLCRDV